ncbi:hypothetical protein HAX41_13505 [Enterococcus faecalis]|uniref:hypothetical protein n=1 Tax=Enterococcus faecalis TaxID=1351 RepID=UPI0018834163|nr:hypothetical protein [Enterococcus faecalis]MBF0021146.1 hypothetical protein [Enterococcus faecalis]
MSYIDFEEFKELTGETDEYKENFDKYLAKATAVIDNVTNYFYQFNDLLADKVTFRVHQFKLALCAQIMYFVEVGADTYDSINNAPQSFSAGRTSISNASRYNSSGNNESKSLTAEDVYLYLEGTGLLYRGVSSC